MSRNQNKETAISPVGFAFPAIASETRSCSRQIDHGGM
jgi:hypothetical protein